MKRNSKTTAALLFALLFAVVISLTAFTAPVLAEGGKDDTGKIDKKELNEELLKEIEENGEVEEEEGTGVHQDPETFRKNFRLSPEQKEYTITAIEDIVSNVLDPNMSDLEKYYTLAVWQNMHVTYDSEFWNGSYRFEHYRHQWDAYGVLTDESVCAGMATFYANLCHAADLPCKFARLKKGCVDHTINYIPDINGNAYYADVTENDFLMGLNNDGFIPYVDKEFSGITKDPTESTFEYWDDGYLRPANLSECYEEKRKNWSTGEFKVTYEDWFNEFALHNSEKSFETDYVEKGSGLPSTDVEYHHASYRDFDMYPPQPYKEVRTNGATGIWFLDDFYMEPTEIGAKIQNKEFDEQLLDISGVKENYDGYTTLDDLVAAVESDISIRYFPTYKNGEIVAEGTNLICGTHYQVTCTEFDAANNKAVIAIVGDGGYSGEHEITVSLDSAVVKKAPTLIKGLTYNGKSQELVKPGKAANGTMVYAACKTDDSEPADGAYKKAIPTGTNAGKYYVWYKALGDSGYSDSKAQRLETAVRIKPMASEVLSDDVTVKVGESVELNPVLNTGRAATYTYISYDDDVATVSDDGVVTGVAEGIVGLVISGKLNNPNPNYAKPDSAFISVQVTPKSTSIKDAKVVLSKSAFTYNGKVQKPSVKTINGLTLKDGTDYAASWSNASSKNAGTYTVTINGQGKYAGTTKATYKINKAVNPMTLKAKTATLKQSKLKKKAQTIKRAKAFTVNKSQGKKTYQLVSAKKGKKSFKKKFKINAKNGNVTVKKGLKKGTYKVKVKVKAAGNANYKASSWKAVTFKVKVK